MPFICPKCDRPLTKEKSWHYCKKISIDELLNNKPAVLIAVFNRLFTELISWDGVSASATKTCIVFITSKTFLVAKVMKNELDLKFTLPKETDQFPIYKMLSYGKKTEHYIRLHDEGDLDGDVFHFIRQSYELTKS